MTMQKLSLPDCGSAMLTLPDPLTPDVIGQLESGWHKLLLTLRRELRGDQPDPGDLEFESWAANLPTSTLPKETS
jgi:hypothetical protein